jgi:NAD(P)H-hydrate epimerase
VIANPGSDLVWVNPTGGSELATAGTGDVLSGVIGAIAASDNREAAAVGAYLHGVAGSIAAETWNERGVVAWDVAEAIPAAMELIGG